MKAVRSQPDATLRDYKARLLRVLLHIQRHLDEPLRVDALAAIACFSPFHFSRVFRGMIGESVKEHFRRLRLERAAWQLLFTRRSVTTIAFEAGYHTHESFTRSFHGHFGLSPSAYRNRHAQKPHQPTPSGVHYQSKAALASFKTARSAFKHMHVTIKNLPPRRVAFMRHVGPYSSVGATWEKMCLALGKDGWLGGEDLFLGVCYDDPEVTAPARIRYDACITVDDSFQPAGEIGVQVIPGGPHAVTTHMGPYERLSATYAKLLGQWLPRSGRELGSSPCFEVYLNSPESTAPEDLLTDVHAPLR